MPQVVAQMKRGDQGKRLTGMKVYVVEGRSGEYSDASEWPVAAYVTRAMAEQHVVLATNEENEHQARKSWTSTPEATAKVYDHRESSYDVAQYSVYELEVRDALPVEKKNA